MNLLILCKLKKYLLLIKIVDILFYSCLNKKLCFKFYRMMKQLINNLLKDAIPLGNLLKIVLDQKIIIRGNFLVLLSCLVLVNEIIL